MRQLFDMHRERKRVMGELAGVQMAWFAKVLTGQKIDPRDLNPYAERSAPRHLSAEQLERESAMAWRLLDKFFGGG